MKYLGVDLDCKLSWNAYKSRIAAKSRATMAMVCSVGMKNLSVAAATNVWTSLVRSQLEYGAEIWGSDTWMEGEYIQHEMGRRILNCGFKTPVAAMMGDLGWCSLRARRDIMRLNYWGKLVLMEDERLPKRVYLKRKSDFTVSNTTSNWCYYTHHLLSSLNLLKYWDNEKLIQSVENWKKEITKKIFEREQKLWWAGCQRKPKLRTYRTIKTELKLEPYLAYGGHLARSVMFSIRSGSCRLRIETGRWKRPREKEEERLCKMCNQDRKVESEIHFVSECEAYADFREHLFSEILRISNGLLNLREDKNNFEIFKIVSGMGWGEGEGEQWQKICKASLNFVYLAMKRRATQLKDRIV